MKNEVIFLHEKDLTEVKGTFFFNCSNWEGTHLSEQNKTVVEQLLLVLYWRKLSFFGSVWFVLHVL